MSETPYSNREINQLLKGQTDTMTSGFREVLEKIEDVARTGARIEEQTIKTNGRVGVLEQKDASRTGMWQLVKWLGIPLFGLWVGFVSWSTAELLKLKDIVSDTPPSARASTNN